MPLARPAMVASSFAFLLCVGCPKDPPVCTPGLAISQAGPISSTATSLTTQDVFVSTNASSGVSLATWVDEGNSQYPSYAFYDPNTGWGTIGTITTSSSSVVPGNVTTSQDPGSGIILATWTANTTNRPMSSLYVPGSGWQTAIPASTNSTALLSTINSFNPATGQFVVAWADSSNHNYPTVAMFKRGTGFSAPHVISTTSRSANIYTSFNASNNQVLAVWVDIDTGRGMYSVYTTAWSTPAPIADSSVENDITVSCNPVTGQCLAAWADVNHSNYPASALYTPGRGWSASSIITTTSSVTGSVTIAADAWTGQFIAAWSAYLQNSNAAPKVTFAFYTDLDGWTEPALLSDGVSASNAFVSFDPIESQFLAVWADSASPGVTHHPTYAILNMCATSNF